jgi:glucokinase
MKDYVIGIDLGASKIALGLIDPQDQIVARERVPTLPLEGPAAAVDRMAMAVGRLLRDLPLDARVTAVGLCSPGPLDHRTGLILDPPNLTGWVNVPLREMLSNRLSLPVVLEHDAKAAALGEFHYGAGRDADDMCYIVVGTGVGAAIIMDGEVRRGSHNSAGEVGHITIDPAGDPCACGSVGCVETFCSGPSLARRYRRALDRHRIPADARPPEPFDGEIVTCAADAGDPAALEVMAEAGEALGTAIATVAMILDIERFVIGSSVVKCGDVLLAPTRDAVYRHAHSSVAQRVQVVASPLGDDGPILGCGWLCRSVYLMR